MNSVFQGFHVKRPDTCRKRCSGRKNITFNFKLFMLIVVIAGGGTVLAGAIGVVGLATAAVLYTGSGETLAQVQSTDVESLSVIAARIAASL